ncbi:MAG: carbohydrate-binding domain-containing protein [Clostridia bacterium]|nr:carbohydrate-binding domain-containing protein [Clostridia bacterium]
MKNNKRTGNLFKRIAALLLILAMTAAFALVSGCGSESETAADGNAAAEFTLPDVEAPAASLAEATVYDVSDATGFVFSDSEITVTDGAYDGYKIEGTSLSITAAGTYVVSGSCSNGTIVVKKNVTGVTLVLSGLDLSASATAPITCNKGSEARIIAAEGTVNNLADDEFNNDDVYTDETLYPDIENAVIKCKDGSNVTICGAGTINVTANGKNGVKGGYDLYEEDENGNATDKLLSEASLTVKEVTLNITAMAGDGLKSDKLLNILSGNITVAAASDGVKSDYVMNIGTKGVDGPTITVTKAEEGVEAATINVWSGSVNVSASEDGINAANSDLENYAYSYNQFGGSVVVDVTGGDGIDSNGTTYLLGGTLEVYAPSQGDGDPLDSDSGTYFGGATVLAVGHTGMAQRYNAATPYAEFSGSGLVSAGGEIRITAADGSVLYTAKAVRDASSVLFSSPDLTSGETCTLNGGATATAGYSSNGGGRGGFGGGQRPDGNKGERPDGGQTSDGEKREHPDGGRRPDGSGTDFRGSGETPPELPDGETPTAPPDGETPPSPPDGEAMPDFPDEGTHA